MEFLGVDIWLYLCGMGIWFFGCDYSNLTGFGMKDRCLALSLGLTLGFSFKLGLASDLMFLLELWV